MRKAYLQMHLAIILWGFTAILGKAVNVDAGMIVWYRMLFSAAGILIFLLLSRQYLKIKFRELIRIAGIGMVVTLHWITFYASIKASNVSIAISCFSSVALFTALLDPLMTRVLPKKGELLLGIAVITGVYIIFSFQQFFLEGIILSLLSAFLAALFTVMNKKLSEKHDPGVITFYEMTTGFLLLTILLPVWFHINNSGFIIPSATDFLWLIILGLVCTSFAFTIALHALKKLDAFTMNLSVNLEPLYSIILAMIFFNEHQMLNTGFYTGSFIIISAVAMHGYLKLKQVRAAKSIV